MGGGVDGSHCRGLESPLRQENGEIEAEARNSNVLKGHFHQTDNHASRNFRVKQIKRPSKHTGSTVSIEICYELFELLLRVLLNGFVFQVTQEEIARCLGLRGAPRESQRAPASWDGRRSAEAPESWRLIWSLPPGAKV